MIVNIEHLIILVKDLIKLFFFAYLLYNIYYTWFILIFIIYLYQKGGSQHSFLYTLTSTFQKPYYEIQGSCDPQFQKVKDLFEQNFIDGMEHNSQVCIYHKGKKVVDLVGCCYKSKQERDNIYLKTQQYTKDTLQNVFSSSKVVSSLVMVMLKDRNLINYEDKISKHWPEFAQNGKEDITIQDLLRHEAGLQDFDVTIDKKWITTEEIKNNKIGEIIEKQKPFKRINEKKNKKIRNYHAVTRGFVLNEIVRRVDPKQRTIGEFVRQEISQPLNAKFYFGMTEEEIEQNLFAKLILTDNWWAFFQSWKFWGKKRFAIPLIAFLFVQFLFPKNMKRAKAYDFNSKYIKQCQIPSANGQGCAAGLAQIGCIMANKGQVNGKQFMKASTVEDSISEAIPNNDIGLFGMETFFCKGGWNYVKEFDRIGWGGYGGSVLNFNVNLEYSFSYTMDLLEADLANTRGYKLLDTFIKCIKKQQ